MKPKVQMILMVIAVVVAYLIYFRGSDNALFGILIKANHTALIFGTIAVAVICFYAFVQIYVSTDSNNLTFETFLYLTPFSAFILLFYSILSLFEMANLWHWVLSVAGAVISIAIAIIISKNKADDIETSYYFGPHYVTKPATFVSGKIILIGLFSAVLWTYLLVFNDSRLPLLGISFNLNGFALHTISVVTSFACFIFTAYALGDNKFNSNYLSIALVMTLFASLLLTIVLVNGINGVGDWFFSIIIALMLTFVSLLIAGSGDTVQSEMRFQD